jgi:hypothetical protein
MIEKNKKWILKFIVGLIVLVAAWLVIKIVGKFLSDFWIQTALAIIITWAILSIGDKIGLPGFSGKKVAKKK